MKAIGILGVLVGASIVGQASAGGCGTPAPPPQPNQIDLVLCLDTSGSMSGLINAARQKLWAVVNDLAEAEPTPTLRVALLTYGNNGHETENGWVRVDTGFTRDLDLISQKLFALRTNGGNEYVGRVLQYAGQLDWAASDSALKLVVVAGNESADQDREVPFREMCRSLIGRGIMINSIFCGPVTDSVAPEWMEVAKLADGQFASIDQDNGTIVVQTPYDQKLVELSAALNGTYIPFGAGGARGLANQAAQDTNAESLNSAAAASRAKTKAQSLYQCSWDLVDACGSGQVKLDAIGTDQLPETMKKMTVDQRQAYVAQMALQRADLQTRVIELSVKRDAFVAAELQRRAVDVSNSFDTAFRRAVRDQAVSKGFRFNNELAMKGPC